MSAGAAEHHIELAGVRYGPRWARGLGRWDVGVGSGRIHHLRAPNGAGKTTWLRAALGLVPARWDRCSLGSAGSGGGRAVRYVPSGVALAPDLPLGAATALLAARAGVDAQDRDEALARWGLAEHDLALGRHLSTGQQRSALLAIALAGPPAAILLDEPTVALDDERVDLLVAEVAAQLGRGAAVLVVGHVPGPWLALGAEVADGR